jgi:hypothetical protein
MVRILVEGQHELDADGKKHDIVETTQISC